MIYFTQDSATLHVKIGHTNGDDAETRRRALQTGNPSELVVLATMPGERADETKLHQRFAPARVAGEWFRPVPELLLLICRARENALPAFDVPAAILPDRRLRFFLAGKMGPRLSPNAGFACWREPIVRPWASLFCDHELMTLEALPVLPFAIFGQHDYLGPYYFDQAGGHGPWSPNDHGCNVISFLEDPPDYFTPIPEPERLDLWNTNCELVRRLALDAIRRCDVLFAWVDTLDCFGTLAEIGYAHAMGRRIWVGSPPEFSDSYRHLWFAVCMAEWHSHASSPLDAFSRAVAWDAARSQMNANAREP